MRLASSNQILKLGSRKCSNSKLNLNLSILRTERSALSGAFLHCFILFVFCFYICIVFLLIFVPLTESYSASTPPPPKAISKIPIFQNSNFPKKPKKPKKNKKSILHRPWGEEGVRQSPGTIVLLVFFFGFLENWNFGKLKFWIFMMSWDIFCFFNVLASEIFQALHCDANTCR